MSKYTEAVEKAEAAKIRKEMASGLPDKGIVNIKIKNPKKTAGLVVRSYKDRPFLTEDGEQRKYVLDKSIKLNMEEMEERLLYGQLIHHPIFKSVFDIEDFETEAVNVLEFKKLEQKATDIIMKLSDKDTKDICRLMLIPVSPGSSINVLKKALFDIVDEDPMKFLEAWEDSDKSQKILFRNLIDAGVCIKKNGRYELNGAGIGTTFEQGVEYLKANEDLLPSLRKQLQAVK